MTHTERWFVAVATVLVLGGCVTLNIDFPAAAAEKAADRIIDEVWQLKQGQAQQQTEEKSQ